MLAAGKPLFGATIELFSVGMAGNGSASTSMLAQPVTTDGAGEFDIAGDYSCPTGAEQVYLVARGGNPGLAAGVDNQAIVLMSPLGNCADLLANPTVLTVNEVTTVSAAYALAPFLGAYDHVGTSATNALGIANAFLNARLLVDTTTGQAATVAANVGVEPLKLYALANALASCTGSDGGQACVPLFTAATPSGGRAPTDVLTALLNIVTHPGNNVSAVFQAAGAAPPFSPALASAPHDWTMSLTVSGGGLSEPTGLAIDKFGNVWVTNYGGPAPAGGTNPVGVVAFSAQGAPFAGTPFGNASQTEAYGLAIDTHGDVWVTSEENIGHGNTTGSVAKFLGASSAAPGTLVGTFYDDSLYFPESIAADTTTNTILIGNHAGSTATVYDLDGNLLRNVGQGYAYGPLGIASDGAGGLWLANQGYDSVTHVLADGTAQNTTCCSTPGALAVDPGGNVWVTNADPEGNAYTFSEVSSTGMLLQSQQSAGGLFTPGGAAVDAGGQFWVANYYDGSFSEIAGNSTTVAAGTGLTPFGLGKDAGLVEPFAIAPDASGNLWISNRAKDTVVMFFGLATPTVTPAPPLPKAP